MASNHYKLVYKTTKKMVANHCRDFPIGKWLHKIRKRPDDLCARCAKVGKKHVEIEHIFKVCNV